MLIVSIAGAMARSRSTTRRLEASWSNFPWRRRSSWPVLLVELEYATDVHSSVGLIGTLDAHLDDQVVLGAQVNRKAVDKPQPRSFVDAIGAVLGNKDNLVRMEPEVQHVVLGGRHQPRDKTAESPSCIIAVARDADWL